MAQQLAPKAVFKRAIELVGSGKPSEALEICRTAVQEDDSDVSMIALTGAILLKMGELAEAETHLRRAIELAPSFAKPHEDLGILLVESGRLDESIPLLQTAVRLDPGSEQAYLSLGRALSLKGRGGEADAAFEASFKLNPERHRLAMAARDHREGRFEEAEKQYRALLSEYPNNVDGLRLLGGILANQSRFDEAEALLRQAIERAPDYTLAIVDLGRLLHEQQRHGEAVEWLERAVAMEPKRPKPHYLLAASFAPLGRTMEALQEYRNTLEISPDHAGALLGIGHTLKTIGEQEEAIEAYRECIRLRPENGESYWSLANLKTYRLTDADIGDIETTLHKAEDLVQQSRVNFLFALAKAYEDRGDFEQAWTHYGEGNQTQRELEHYDSVRTEVTNDEIIETFSLDFLESSSGGGCEDPSPIFVVGLPRSGSTLIEQILASHSMVEGTSELPYIGRVATSLNRNRADGVNYPHAIRELGAGHFAGLGEDYLRRANLHRFGREPHFVDKMPNNFPSIGLIHLILPNARIIDARRYPLDATLSCYRQLFAKGQTFVYDLDDIGEYYLEYQRLMDHWHEALPDRVLTVQYEDMVTDPENQVRRLLEYCGLPWEDACLSFYETDRPVRTASSEQVRQPIYSTSIHHWRNYDKHLGDLKEILAPILPRYAHYEGINR